MNALKNLAAAALIAVSLPAAAELPRASYIVQAAGGEAASAVERVGGRVTHRLAVIRAVAAELTDAQLALLERDDSIRRVWPNGVAELSGRGGNGGRGGKQLTETYYPTHLGADLLHGEGIDGSGVTIAVLDSGSFDDDGLLMDPRERRRILAHYDAVLDRHRNVAVDEYLSDPHGHGSHVTSIAVSSRVSATGLYNGMAPDADLTIIKAFDRYGQGTYADVIRGIDWAVTHKDTYGIRVLNCSFSAEPQSYYWDDPLNQALMAAWQMGIVVVASAGNRGPDPMTIGVPGNLPYVITVGAMTDNYTPNNHEDDVLASFSSTGPTVEAFVKPDVVAPGGHVKGLMLPTSQIAQDHHEFHDGGYYFNMSGTSQATAFVTGIVALMLEADPALTPDEVKYRLMASADRASFSDGSPVYSIFQQGAGLVNAYNSVHTTRSGAANGGMDISLDLLGLQHYRGPADGFESPGKKSHYEFFIRDANGDPIEDDGYLWNGDYAYQDGFVWSDAFVWNDAFIWNDAFVWSDTFIWSDAFVWGDGFIWTDLHTEALFTESWVPQE